MTVHCHTYEYVADKLNMYTVVRIHNSYICVCVSHFEFKTSANKTKTSNLIKLQRTFDTVGLCRPDVVTDLYCLPLTLSRITLYGAKSVCMLFICLFIFCLFVFCFVCFCCCFFS